MRDEAFRIEDGFLVRSVVPARGRPYEHRCPRGAYEAVAYAVDESGQQPFTLTSLAQRTGLPWTQVNTALAFLKERGCIVPVHGRKHTAACASAYEDAMVEYHALREKGPAEEALGHE